MALWNCWEPAGSATRALVALLLGGCAALFVGCSGETDVDGNGNGPAGETGAAGGAGGTGTGSAGAGAAGEGGTAAAGGVGTGAAAAGGAATGGAGGAGGVAAGGAGGAGGSCAWGVEMEVSVPSVDVALRDREVLATAISNGSLALLFTEANLDAKPSNGYLAQLHVDSLAPIQTTDLSQDAGPNPSDRILYRPEFAWVVPAPNGFGVAVLNGWLGTWETRLGTVLLNGTLANYQGNIGGLSLLDVKEHPNGYAILYDGAPGVQSSMHFRDDNLDPAGTTIYFPFLFGRRGGAAYDAASQVLRFVASDSGYNDTTLSSKNLTTAELFPMGHGELTSVAIAPPAPISAGFSVVERRTLFVESFDGGVATLVKLPNGPSPSAWYLFTFNQDGSLRGSTQVAEAGRARLIAGPDIIGVLSQPHDGGLDLHTFDTSAAALHPSPLALRANTASVNEEFSGEWHGGRFIVSFASASSVNNPQGVRVAAVCP